MNISQESYIRKSSTKNACIFAVMTIILITLILIALSIGSTKINVIGAIKAAVNNNHSDISFRILFHLRMPRVIASIMAGAALAVAGAAIQAVLNNPLASTSIIGVNSGAGLFVIIFIALSPVAYIYLPLIAFAGAFCACFITPLSLKSVFSATPANISNTMIVITNAISVIPFLLLFSRRVRSCNEQS